MISTQISTILGNDAAKVAKYMDFERWYKTLEERPLNPDEELATELVDIRWDYLDRSDVSDTTKASITQRLKSTRIKVVVNNAISDEQRETLLDIIDNRNKEKFDQLYSWVSPRGSNALYKHILNAANPELHLDAGKKPLSMDALVTVRNVVDAFAPVFDQVITGQVSGAVVKTAYMPNLQATRAYLKTLPDLYLTVAVAEPLYRLINEELDYRLADLVTAIESRALPAFDINLTIQQWPVDDTVGIAAGLYLVTLTRGQTHISFFIRADYNDGVLITRRSKPYYTVKDAPKGKEVKGAHKPLYSTESDSHMKMVTDYDLGDKSVPGAGWMVPTFKGLGNGTASGGQKAKKKKSTTPARRRDGFTKLDGGLASLASLNGSAN